MTPRGTLSATLAALLAAVAASLCIGRFPLHPAALAHFLLAECGLATMRPDRFALAREVVLGARLPRIAGAVLVGAALSVSGASYQAVFRNPLVSPGIMGVLSGAGFGAAAGFLLGGSPALVATLSFAGGMLAVGVGVAVAGIFGGGSLLMLVFGGIISNALFTAMLSILKYVADPDNQLPDIVFWLLGSLANVTPRALGGVALPLAVGIVLLAAAGRLLDALAMGDDEARTLGVPVTALRYGVIAVATVLSALTVSLTGVIGWIGLLVPHLARLLGGPANNRLLPLSAAIGAIFLLVSDDIARTATLSEIPIGIVTDFLGVVLFLFVLPRVGRSWR